MILLQVDASQRLVEAASRLRRDCARRGMAVVLVLGMIAMTLAVSYTLLRAQTDTIRSSPNIELRSEARQAAWSGLAAALRRKNQSSNWLGADSTLAGTINMFQSYSVRYTTGDASIAAHGQRA